MKALIGMGTADGPEVALAEAALPGSAPGRLIVAPLAAGVTRMEPHWSTSWVKADGTPRTSPVILGREFSGMVVDVGAQVVGFSVGQRVFGMVDAYGDGCIAERVSVSPDEVIPLPHRLDAVGAATMPLSGLTAWQALVVHGRLRAGEKVLIHGAAGGVGAFAVQIARWLGARTVATAGAGDADFCRELGADEVIDFRRERFEDLVEGVDLVLDTVGGQVQERSWGVLRRGGRLVTIAGEAGEAPDQARAAATGVEALFFIVEMDRVQLAKLRDLAVSGHVVPVVGRRIPFQRAVEAFAAPLRGAGSGKTVILMPLGQIGWDSALASLADLTD